MHLSTERPDYLDGFGGAGGRNVSSEVSGVNGTNGTANAKFEEVNGSHDTTTSSVHVENGNGHATSSPSSSFTPEKLDVLVIGAGFAGIYLLHQLRKRNFKAKIVETAPQVGGVWYWNRYPGAQADTQYPLYALSLPDVYEDWDWESHYPTSSELRRYFAHADKKLQISKDTYFNTKVVEAEFSEATNLWAIRCDTGRVFEAPYFIASIGFAAKRYMPDWPGMDTFKGEIHHSSFWPVEGIDVKGKRVGVLGSGSTGVQIVAEWTKEISDHGDLKMFQRTPNFCCPMKNVQLTAEEQIKDKLTYTQVYDDRFSTWGGFGYQFRDERMLDKTPEEREALFEELWNMGGFRFLMNNYSDMTRDLEANRYAYEFWRKKVLPVINDPEKAKLLAPEIPPHPFGAKRLALNDDFHDSFNRPNVHVVDIKNNPVVRFEPEGVLTADGTLHKLDVIAIATGFDGLTGGLKDIKIKGRNGKLLAEKWQDGTLTYLGMSCAGFPNFFFTLGPQAPSAFANGPACVELQGGWLAEMLDYMRSHKKKCIEARPEAELKWRSLVNELSAKGLRHYTASWWNGGNIPGKLQEALNYAGGLPSYINIIKQAKDDGYTAYDLE